MKKLSGYFYLFLAFTLAGTSVVSARYVSGKLGPFTITALSQMFALLFLVPISFRKLRKEIKELSRKDIMLLLLQAFCGMFLFRMFLLNGLLHTSTGEAGILTGATPAITALLAMLVLKEAPNSIKLSGVVSTVIGIVLLQGILIQGNYFTMEHLVGNLMVLGAAACESLFNVFSRILAVKKEDSKSKGLTPYVQTTLVSAITLLLCLIPAILEHTSPFAAGMGGKEWLSLFWYGVFVTALAFICWYSGIKRCGAITAAAFSGMMPFTSMLLSILLLGEIPLWQQWLGGLFIIVGMILIGFSPRCSLTASRSRIYP